MMERDFAKCCRSMSFRGVCKWGAVDNVPLGMPRCRDMPFPAHFCAACLDGVLRVTFSERFIRMQFFIASASTRFGEILKRGCDYSQSKATVTFIISAESTYSHCQPPFWKPGVRRSPSLQASRWHYAVADKCNSLALLGEGMDESFVTTATTASPTAFITAGQSSEI